MDTIIRKTVRKTSVFLLLIAVLMGVVGCGMVDKNRGVVQKGMEEYKMTYRDTLEKYVEDSATSIDYVLFRDGEIDKMV